MRTTNEGKRRAKKHVQTDKKERFFVHRQTDRQTLTQREKKRYPNPNSFLFTNLHFVFTELR